MKEYDALEKCREFVEKRGYKFSVILHIAQTLRNLERRQIPRRKQEHPTTKTWSRKKKTKGNENGSKC